MIDDKGDDGTRMMTQVMTFRALGKSVVMVVVIVVIGSLLDATRAGCHHVVNGVSLSLSLSLSPWMTVTTLLK